MSLIFIKIIKVIAVAIAGDYLRIDSLAVFSCPMIVAVLDPALVIVVLII